MSLPWATRGLKIPYVVRDRRHTMTTGNGGGGWAPYGREALERITALRDDPMENSDMRAAAETRPAATTIPYLP
ncbi:MULTISPECIES: hypothetical protein [Streptomyces]|uniref:Uncharacterized protein n=1 Tax=Streptomyces virginiae TaxID=1961 RepID=A0ABZ1T4K5_STRVG|nr:hypothetical protein [Streptomyces virginiae]WTB20888.1 hypothetical protein OG253_04945 [Streptomyces virginiae]